MTKAEARIMVGQERGGMLPGQGADVGMRWALERLVNRAVELTSERWLFPLPLDTVAGEEKVRIPRAARAIRGVDLLTTGGRIPLTPISWSQREHPNEPAFAAPPQLQSAYCYRVVHRTLYIYPTPSESKSPGLEMFAWCVPDLPHDDADEQLPIPVEAERFFISAAAFLALPSADDAALRRISSMMADARREYDRWLLSVVEDVGPSVASDGIL